MRRFITTLPGKVFSHFVALALLLPSFTLLFATRAQAQIQTLPGWAVVEFSARKPEFRKYGSAAAEAVGNELAKTGRYDVQPQETVSRAVSSLGLQSPVTDDVSLLRLGQELRVSTLVTGEIVNARVQKVSGGKQADVIVRVIVRDVASNLPINGSATTGSSTIRTGDVDDETVIQEALQAVGARVVADINSKTLPSATVQNTLESTAFINQGSRSGFTNGMQVIVLRGREQVATARVFNVEFDSASIRIERSSKGLQPGDRVRSVFNVPQVTENFGADGSAQPVRVRKSGNNSGAVSTLLVLGLVFLLAGGIGGGGSGGSSSVAKRVQVEATLDNAGRPAARITWSTDAFAKGNSNRVAWQIWRNDGSFLDTPVLVVPASGASRMSATDTTVARNLAYADYGRVGGVTCDNTEPTTDDAEAVAGLTPGRSLRYEVELIYKINGLDLPGAGGGSGGTGGTNTGGGTGGNNTGGGTGGNNTGGNNTGGNNTGGGTGGGNTGGTGGNDEDCYFVSPRSSSSGFATPIVRPTLVAPAQNATVAGPSSAGGGTVLNRTVTFTFQSVLTLDDHLAEYIVEVSSSSAFAKNSTREVGEKLISGGRGQLSIRADNNFFTGANAVVWWRVGARIQGDKPGPVADKASGKRYIYSAPNRFVRPDSPPPPPAP